MGDLHVSNKIDENSDMKICNNNQNFKGPYIARCKNSVQELFLFIEDAWHQSYCFYIYIYLPDQNYRILWIPKFPDLA